MILQILCLLYTFIYSRLITKSHCNLQPLTQNVLLLDDELFGEIAQLKRISFICTLRLLGIELIVHGYTLATISNTEMNFQTLQCPVS